MDTSLNQTLELNTRSRLETRFRTLHQLTSMRCFDLCILFRKART